MTGYVGGMVKKIYKELHTKQMAERIVRSAICFVFRLEFQCCKKIIDGFGAANHGDAVVFVE